MILEFKNITYNRNIDTSELRNAFHRGDNLQHGSGLGLWLCAEIIRLHNGTLSLASVEQQFSVTIELPLT